MSCREAHIGVQGGGQASQRGDSWLGSAFFDALDPIDGQLSPTGQLSNTETKGAALIVNSLAEGQGLADGNPLRIFSVLRQAYPASVVALLAQPD